MKRWSTPMISLDWLRARDRGLAALRRAGRAAQIASNVDRAAAAERRSWLERVLGRHPEGSRGRWRSRRSAPRPTSRDDASGGDRAAARRELLASSERMVDWYDTFGASLTGEGEVPGPIEHDQVADRRLIDAVSNDLRREDGRASATAARMVWTGDHLDAPRVLQGAIVGPARAASEQRTLAPRLLALPWFVQRSRHGPPHSPPPGHRPR